MVLVLDDKLDQSGLLEKIADDQNDLDFFYEDSIYSSDCWYFIVFVVGKRSSKIKQNLNFDLLD